MEPFTDPYHKNRLAFHFATAHLTFDTAALLFSPHTIDPSQQLLLAALHPHLGAPQRALVIGCSYGVIGLTLAALTPATHWDLCDQELLALRYTAHNAALNRISNIALHASIAAEHAPAEPYDLIVATIPPKINDRAIEHEYVLHLRERLKPGGELWLLGDVQINRLLPKLARQHRLHLYEQARDYGAIIYRSPRSGGAV